MPAERNRNNRIRECFMLMHLLVITLNHPEILIALRLFEVRNTKEVGIFELTFCETKYVKVSIFSCKKKYPPKILHQSLEKRLENSEIRFAPNSFELSFLWILQGSH